MMKRLLYFVCSIPLAAAVLLSCDDEQLAEDPVVSVSGLETSYQYEAVPDGGHTFTITSNVNWYIEMKDLDWLKVSPGRGLGSKMSQTVEIIPSENTQNQERQGTMTVVAGDFRFAVEMNQLPGSLEAVFEFVEGVEDGKFMVDAYDVYGASFRIKSNRDWKASLQGLDWATVGPLSGNRGKYATIQVKADNVNAGNARSGSIVFTYDDDKTKTVTVTQRKFAPVINVLKDGVSAGSKVNVLSIGEALQLTVDSNADWNVVSSVDWAKPSLIRGEYGTTDLTITVQPNITGAERTATITFTNHGTSKTLTLKQGKEMIALQENKIAVGVEGGKDAVTVTSNVKWTYICEEDWVILSKSGDDLIVTVNNAGTEDVRSAVVTVYAEDNPLIYQELTIVQSSSYVDLEIPLYFNSSDLMWNTQNNRTYASKSKIKKPEYETGEGTGFLISWTYPKNPTVYAQVVDNNDYGLLYAFDSDGKIAFMKIWTLDAIEFHIPVVKAEKGKTLRFDYGLEVLSSAPKFWNTEISLDKGATWTSMSVEDDENLQEAPNGNESNTVAVNKTNYYSMSYRFTKTIERAEIIVRICCVDGSVGRSGGKLEEPSAGDSFKVIGTASDSLGPRLCIE